MKKLITLTLTFVLALTLVLALVPSVYAEGPVETVDVELYLWSEEDESIFTYDDVIYGQPFVVDASLFAEDGRFVAWVVDGVKSDEPAETAFIATSNMKLELIFAPTAEYAAVFVDSNGHVIDVVYVDAETAVVAPENLPDKPGFELATPHWNQALGLIDADTFYQIRYQLDTDTEFTITVDGEPQNYLYNSVVTLSTELSGFTAWLEDGQVVSYDINYTFTALSDRTLVASNDESYTEAPLVTLLDVSPLRDGYSSFVGQVQLPEGYELVEAGLLFSDSDEAPIYATADTVLKSAAFHPVTNEFLRSILDANMTDYVRAYAVVRDTEDNLETIYSFVEETSSSEEFMVTFESNGGSDVTPAIILAGQLVLAPINPVKENYVFSGWFIDQALEAPFDFETMIETDITLYAKWNPISEPSAVDYSLEGDTLLWDEIPDAIFYDVYVGEDAIDPYDVDTPWIDLKPYESALLEPTKIEVYAVYPFGNSVLIVDIILQYQNHNIAYQTGFEADEGFMSSTQYNNLEPELHGPENYQYSIVRGSASVGSQAFPVISGSQGMQLRWYTANPAVMGYIETTFTLSHVSSIRFTAKSSHHHLKVSYNTDDETNINPEVFVLTGTPQIFTYEVPTNDEISIRFELVQVSSTNSSPIFIDDIIIYSSLGDNTLVELPKAPPADYPETDEVLLLELKNQFQGARNALAAPGFTIPMSNEGLLNYYASLNELTGEAFRTELQNILMNTHTRLISYNEARFILEQSDLITDDQDRQYLDGIYASTKIVKYWDGGATWAREHVWPNSRLAMDRVEGSQRNQASDVHNLRAINPSVNSSRSNRYFDQGLSSINQLVGTTAYYPGDEYIGDVARILFYMVVRYHNILTLADIGIDDYPAYSEEGAIMGILTLLLAWHELDPVSDFERNRNDIIYSYQGNRNPFIDFPEYVEVYFE